jgi:hypothetical protein
VAQAARVRASTQTTHASCERHVPFELVAADTADMLQNVQRNVACNASCNTLATASVVRSFCFFVLFGERYFMAPTLVFLAPKGNAVKDF